MKKGLNRRDFIERAAVSTAAVGLSSNLTTTANAYSRIIGSNDRIVVGVMGMKRGKALASRLAVMKNVEVGFVCEVDAQRADDGARTIEKLASNRPTLVPDFRKILDDDSLDALVCAAPNHWHGPATIMGCAAGKHVYVEKPACQNPREGEWMIAAAQKHNRIVQVGMQRRSDPGMIESVQKLKEGIIGRISSARSWYNNNRQSIGIGKQTTAPSNLDYELWQGPAPRRPYSDKLIPYNWHWFWHWGNGELGNNGVHTLDICRWVLGVDYPDRVTSVGGRYRWNDGQETPDTQTVCFDYGDRGLITWQGLSCNRHGSGFTSFYGEDGAMDLASDGSHILYDKLGKQIGEFKSAGRGEPEHLANFVDAIRNDDGGHLTAGIKSGHLSALMCHLGNIAQRTGRAIECDQANGQILNDAEAMAYWEREYEPGWKPIT